MLFLLVITTMENENNHQPIAFGVKNYERQGKQEFIKSYSTFLTLDPRLWRPDNQKVMRDLRYCRQINRIYSYTNSPYRYEIGCAKNNEILIFRSESSYKTLETRQPNCGNIFEFFRIHLL